jgi:hypothetical protein
MKDHSNQSAWNLLTWNQWVFVGLWVGMLAMLVACGQTCKENERAVRVSKRGYDGKMYTDTVCVYDPIPELSAPPPMVVPPPPVLTPPPVFLPPIPDPKKGT